MKNAIVTGYTFCGYNGNDEVYNIFYTFTDDDGNYTLTPFDFNHPNDPSTQFIQKFSYSALGAEGNELALANTTMLQMVVPASSSFYKTKKISLNSDETVENKVVHNGEYLRGAGSLTLEISPNNHDVVIEDGGNANFKALNLVHAEPGFNAQIGCEAHLYCDTVNADCNDMNSSNLDFRYASSNHFNSDESKNLELHFTRKPELFQIIPNPSDGFFSIIYSGKSLFANLKVYDSVGNLNYSAKMLASRTELNLTSFPKGLYFISLEDQSTVITKRIIIQ